MIIKSKQIAIVLEIRVVISAWEQPTLVVQINNTEIIFRGHSIRTELFRSQASMTRIKNAIQALLGKVPDNELESVAKAVYNHLG